MLMIRNEFVLLTLPFVYTLEITVYSISKYTLCQVEVKPLLDLISTDNYLDGIASVVLSMLRDSYDNISHISVSR